MSATYQFKGKLIKVQSMTRRLPNGHLARLDVIEHPGAVLIVPFLDPQHLIFIHQFRPVLNTYLYELPAGTLNLGEGPRVCASRELMEETGVMAGKIKRIGKIVPVPGYSTEVISIFKAEDLSSDENVLPSQIGSSKKWKVPQVLKHKEADEVIRVCVLSVSQIRTFFRRGKIFDAKTICALAFCGIL